MGKTSTKRYLTVALPCRSQPAAAVALFARRPSTNAEALMRPAIEWKSGCGHDLFAQLALTALEGKARRWPVMHVDDSSVATLSREFFQQ